MDADRILPTAGEADASLPGRDDALPGRHDAVSGAPEHDHTPPQAHPLPTGRRRARHAEAPQVPQEEQGGRTTGPGPSDQPSPPAQPGGWDMDDASGQGPAAQDGPGADSGLPASGPTTHTTGTTTAEQRPRRRSRGR